MAGLRLSHIYKVYDNGHKAVNDFNMEIQDKEFIVIVGPSGCGKSTTLRMVAGLESITAGDLFIGDTLVNDMEPKDRDIAMVFQNYALYPHMSVYENMAFGLRNRKVPEEEIKAKVKEAAKILGIEEYLDRKPKAMSGGQRQRVALGRAIVRDPKVFLLDEPLSNLDAKLRAQMRTEISKLHKKLETTFIYVTHDQVEAMTMGTRIVVMKLGYVQQIDTPMNLYNKPKNKFVAGFIGTPQMNFFDVVLNRNGDNVEVKFKDGSKIDLDYEIVAKAPDVYLHGDRNVILGIRPEHITISEKETGLSLKANVVEHLGNECIIYGNLGNDSSETINEENQIIVKCVEGTKVEVGDVIYLTLNPEKIHLFDSKTEDTILEDIPPASRFEMTVNGNEMTFLGKTLKAPQVFLDAMNGKEKADVLIPPSSVVKGNDYSLKVHEIEEIEGKRLAHLEVNDRYLFALVDESVQAGDEYSFSLLNDKLTLVNGEETLLLPIGEKESMIGTFQKKEVKENRQRVLKFYYHINGVSILAPVDNGYKMNTIEGTKSYKNNYKYVIDRKDIHLAEMTTEETIPATVDSIIDYGNIRYAKLNVDGSNVLVPVDEKFDKKEALIEVKGENIEVYSLDIDMKIC